MPGLNRTPRLNWQQLTPPVLSAKRQERATKHHGWSAAHDADFSRRSHPHDYLSLVMASSTSTVADIVQTKELATKEIEQQPWISYLLYFVHTLSSSNWFSLSIFQVRGLVIGGQWTIVISHRRSAIIGITGMIISIARGSGVIYSKKYCSNDWENNGWNCWW